MSTRIKLRVSDSERAALGQAARSAGMSLTDYVLARVISDDHAGPSWCATEPRDRHVEMLWQEGDVERVDAAAAAHGMDRAGYVRARVWGTPAAPKPVRGQLVQRVTQTREVDRRDAVVETAIVDLLEQHPAGLSASRIVEETGRNEAEVIPALGALVGDATLVLDGERYRLA